MSQAQDRQGRRDDDSKEAMAEHKEAATGLVAKAKNGIVLVPQPSDDPRDPLVSYHS